MVEWDITPNYKALNTDEVEKFLQHKHHLPWLTSAKNVEKEHNGAINLTRMDFQTVETAENLQLQIIRLNDAVKEQQAEIEALKKELSVISKQP